MLGYINATTNKNDDNYEFMIIFFYIIYSNVK